MPTLTRCLSSAERIDPALVDVEGEDGGRRVEHRIDRRLDGPEQGGQEQSAQADGHQRLDQVDVALVGGRLDVAPRLDHEDLRVHGEDDQARE